MSGKGRLDGRFGRKALKCLKEITNILEKADVRYCLDGGTLLGVIREQRLLPWDDDIDLFASSEDAQKLEKLKWAFVLRGYKVIMARMNEDYGPMKKGDLRIFKLKTRKWGFLRNKEQKLLVDIIVKYPDENDYYWSIGVTDVVNKKIARPFYDQMDSVQFDGKIYPIPSNVEEYLTRRYGDWREPVYEWDYKRDDKAALDL